MVAEPDEAASSDVLVGDGAQRRQHLVLGAGGRQVEAVVLADHGGHRLVHEVLERVDTEVGEHLVAVAG